MFRKCLSFYTECKEYACNVGTIHIICINNINKVKVSDILTIIRQVKDEIATDFSFLEN